MATSYSDWVYYGSSCCALRIKWTYTDSNATCAVKATLQRWDKYAQSGQGSVTLSQTSTSGGSANFGSCNNDQTRDICSTTSYTYSKGTSTKTVTASVSTNDWFATITDGGYVTIGKISFSKTFTISKKTSYTVKYAANGGSSTPSSQTKWYGTALTLAAAISHTNVAASAYTVTLNHNYSGSTNGSLSASRTTKYTFSKWKATNGTQYAAKGSYTANAATTMTAQWTTSTTTAAVTLTMPTRSGYSFDGWATSSTGAKAYSGGASYTPSSAVTLWARWNRTVTYHANGGQNAPASQTVLATSAVEVAPQGDMNRDGYRFLGWNTAADGSGTSYSAGSSYAAQNPNVTLYAQWQVLLNISVTSVVRCTSGGVADPLGDHCRVAWSWTNGDGTAVTPSFAVSTSPVSDSATVTPGSASVSGNHQVTLDSIDPETDYTVSVSGTTVGTSTTTVSMPKTYTEPVIYSVKTNRVDSSHVLDDAGEVLAITISWAVCASTANTRSITVSAVDTDGNSVAIPTQPSLTKAYSGTETVYVTNANNDLFSADKQYAVTVTLVDALGNSSAKGDALSSAFFPFDVLGDAYYYEPTEDSSVVQGKTYYVMDETSGWYKKYEPDGSYQVPSGFAYHEDTGYFVKDLPTTASYDSTRKYIVWNDGLDAVEDEDLNESDYGEWMATEVGYNGVHMYEVYGPPGFFYAKPGSSSGWWSALNGGYYSRIIWEYGDSTSGVEQYDSSKRYYALAGSEHDSDFGQSDYNDYIGWTDEVGEFVTWADIRNQAISPTSVLYEKTGPRPGHGVSFGAPCKDEGFHVHMPADFSNGTVKLRNQAIERGVAPESAVYGGDGTLQLVDKNNSQIGYLQSYQLVSGEDGVQLGVGNSDKTDWNTLQLGFDENDNPVAKLSKCVEIGAVDVDNYTGGVMIHGSNFVTSSQTASSDLWGMLVGGCDSSKDLRSYFRHIQFTNGRQGTQVETRRLVNGSYVYNGVQMIIEANGTRVVVVSDAAAWRNALGASSGIWPVSLGGTGRSGHAFQNTPGDAVSVATGTFTQLATISLDAGHWLATVAGYAATNTTGRRYFGLTTDTAANHSLARLEDVCFTNTGGPTYCLFSRILTPTSTTTYRVHGWQNSGAKLSMSAYIRAYPLFTY